MVQSQQLRTAQKAIRSLLTHGIAEREVHQLVSAIAVETGSACPPGEDLPIYDELPPGLISLPMAAVKYARATGTLRVWAGDGRLTTVGRLRAPAPGGGYLVFLETEVAKVNIEIRKRSR